EQEETCKKRLEEIVAEGAAITQAVAQIYSDTDAAKTQIMSIQAQIAKITAVSPEEETQDRLEDLLAEEARLSEMIERMEEEAELLREQHKTLAQEQKEAEDRLDDLKEQRKEQEKQVGGLSREEDEFLERCAAVAGTCEKAYRQTEEIRKELETAKKVKANCEKVLESVRFIIGEEATKEYRKELEKYKFYESAEGYDFEQMKSTLSQNTEILCSAGKCFSGKDAAALKTTLEALRKEREPFREYSFEGLKLNYGEMSLEEDLSKQAKDILTNAAGEGFLGFLTEKKVSEKVLDTAYLPSGSRYEAGKAPNVFSALGTNVTEMLEELRQMLPGGETAGGMAENIADAVLFHSYLMTHFSNFQEESKNGALSYEAEYLIAGKAGDKENLFSIAMRLCVLRAALHFISLYTDSTRKLQAEQAALAACGVIGLPALKSVITFVLLFVWAVEEAMIDTAALLLGKKLELYPGRGGGSLTFPEIFLFSRELVLKNAKTKKEAKGVGFGYRDYIQVYLFLTPKDTKCYRALDIIQENLRKDYRDSFRVNRCVWKVSYRVDKRAYWYSYDG
ncbi:MAG: DUF5702 domain-containing protein, partial [Lachnospiraceae bacterium]